MINEPVIEFWSEDQSQIKTATWYDQNFQLHREEDEPSKIGFYETGEISYEEWYQQGKIHRATGPAKIHYWRNGNAMVEFWFHRGILHRRAGQAELWFFPDGSFLDAKWFLNGEQVASQDEDFSWWA
jgi:hypothetical protein